MVLNRHQPSVPRPASIGPDEFGAAAIRDRINRSLREGGSATAGWSAEFQALGTVCRLTLAGPQAAAKEFTAQTIAWVAAFEAKYSRFLPGSLISRINDQAGKDWVALDPESERLFGLCHELHFLSRGVLDPTVLPLLKLWNWKAKPPVLPSDEAIREVQQRVGWSKVQRAPGRIFLPLAGMGLDLGGMGKEFAVDQIGLLARQFPLTGALIDFGADIRVVGLPPDGRPGWHIGLEDPQSPGRVWRGLAARECAVATSGNYLRHFEIDGVRYGHILDPRTGRPTPVQVLAVSVLAPSCTQAGLLSTSALVLGVVEGLRLIDSTPGAAGVILTAAQTFQSRRFHEHVAS
jgi:thiamine biosynthesis lipoprotein